MRKTQFVAGIAACMLAFAGCGDDTTDSNVDNSNAGGATAGGATQGNMGADDDAGGDTQGGATQGTNSGGVDAGAATAGGTDAGMSTGGKDAGMMSTGDDPNTPGHDSNKFVSCGGTPKAEVPCSLETQSCCVKGFSKGAESCNEGTTCGKDLGTRTPCDGPEDCAGKPCCVDIVAGTAQCSKTSTCPLASVGKVCHKDADCDAPKTCAPGSTFSFWGVCN